MGHAFLTASSPRYFGTGDGKAGGRRRSSFMISAGVAGCIQNEEPTQVLEAARKRFRCISFDRLKMEDFSTSLGVTDLSGKTEQSDLGGVDAFISYAW